MHYTHICKLTCSQKIEFDINNGIVSNISFLGGCNGNLKAISKILDGQCAEFIIKKLKGNTCGLRPTSCADQLAQAVEKAYEEERK